MEHLEVLKGRVHDVRFPDWGCWAGIIMRSQKSVAGEPSLWVGLEGIEVQENENAVQPSPG